jgi:RNA polymerase primary sigma factor
MSDAFGDYLRAIGRIPLLTPSEELHLGALVQQWIGDPGAGPSLVRRGRRAMARMVTANLRLVVSVCKHYQNRIRQLHLDPMDVVQAGNLGLIRAVERYQPSRGYKFSTYGYWWIRQAVNRHLQDRVGTIRVPAQVADLALKAQAIQSASGVGVSVAELAHQLGETEKRVGFVLRAVHESRALSLDQQMCASDGDSCLADLVGREDVVAPDADDYRWLHLEIDQLSSLEKGVIHLRYGHQEGLSMAKAAERLGITKDKVQRIEKQVLHKLRQRVEPMLFPA